MRSNVKNVSVWMMALLLPIMVLACSGGGGSSSGDATPPPAPQGAATSLQVADKVSVVDAKLSGSVAAVAPLKIGFFTARATSFSATSDYNTDKNERLCAGAFGGAVR